jgi:protein SYS1
VSRLGGTESALASSSFQADSGACRVIAILLLIARSKLVLDFALTLHFINLVVTSLYTRRLPTNLLWWTLQAASSLLMIFLGVWACQWRELRPVSFGAILGGGDGSSVGRAKQTPSLPLEDGGAEEEESGLSRIMNRIRGRTANTDGAGDYEMVGMEDRGDV